MQRSGIAIDDARAPGYGRPAGHPGDTSVGAWSGPDAERLYPGWSCPGTFDVSGGWYDAGDHGKYVPSGAMAVWQLLATVELIRRRGTLTEWWALSPLGWHIDPQALRDLLARLVRNYGRRPIWITENGIPDDAAMPPDRRLQDDHRIAYLAGHLDALSAAITDGADVQRYFVWSLLDSFEWELGYGTPFGLIHVDRKTQRRPLKQSAHWYRDTIARARSSAARGEVE